MQKQNDDLKHLSVNKLELFQHLSSLIEERYNVKNISLGKLYYY